MRDVITGSGEMELDRSCCPGRPCVMRGGGRTKSVQITFLIAKPSFSKQSSDL